MSRRDEQYSSSGGAVPYIPLSPDEPNGNGADGAGDDRSIGQLFSDATTHMSALVRAEVELAKSEVIGEVKKGVTGSVFFIVAGVVALYSSFFFFFFLADLLTLWLPRWAASLIVWGLMLALVAVCGFLGYRKIKRVRAPQKTIGSVKETAAALRRKPGEPEAAQLTEAGRPAGDRELTAR